MSILLPLRGLNREPLRRVAAVVCLGWLGASPLLAQAPASNGAAAQATAAEPAAPQAVSADQLKKAIDSLGNLDYDTRTSASRLVRRTPGAQAVPALLQAVAEHADGYVRYRALVLLTGFNDPRTRDAMRESMSSSNDRLRTVAYSYFEHNPDRAMVPDLLVMNQEDDE